MEKKKGPGSKVLRRYWRIQKRKQREKKAKQARFISVQNQASLPMLNLGTNRA